MWRVLHECGVDGYLIRSISSLYDGRGEKESRFGGGRGGGGRKGTIKESYGNHSVRESEIRTLGTMSLQRKKKSLKNLKNKIKQNLE